MGSRYTIPTKPPDAPIASSWRSVRLREDAQSACAAECEATIGPTAARSTSQKPASLRWLRSTRMPSSAQRRIRASPGAAEPWAEIGRRRPYELYAVGEVVGPAPDRSQRPQSRCVPQVERLELGVDRLGALEVQHRGRRAVPGFGRVEVCDRPRDRDVPAALEAREPAGSSRGVRRRLRMRNLRREFDRERPVRLRDGFPLVVLLRRREDREDCPSHASGLHPRDVEMAVFTSRGERLVALRGQRVVVSVEYGRHRTQPTRPAAIGEATRV